MIHQCQIGDSHGHASRKCLSIESLRARKARRVAVLVKPNQNVRPINVDAIASPAKIL